MSKIFHYTHYLGYISGIPAIYYIFHGAIVRGQNFMHEIGLGVFFLGISLAFASMNDIQKFSAEEIELFSTPEKFKKKARSIVILGFVILSVSLFFISIKWLNTGNGSIAEQYFQLGINCLPLVIAVFFELKQLIDKKIIFELRKKQVA